jgi:hypothetical protein
VLISFLSPSCTPCSYSTPLDVLLQIFFAGFSL